MPTAEKYSHLSTNDSRTAVSIGTQADIHIAAEQNLRRTMAVITDTSTTGRSHNWQPDWFKSLNLETIQLLYFKKGDVGLCRGVCGLCYSGTFLIDILWVRQDHHNFNFACAFHTQNGTINEQKLWLYFSHVTGSFFIITAFEVVKHQKINSMIYSFIVY